MQPLRRALIFRIMKKKRFILEKLNKGITSFFGIILNLLY